ncbi:MAG: hypothetical protein VX899_17030 [Myxococcota bacterium]|nr:hypothetical protein [Myxococcota bacterium]
MVDAEVLINRLRQEPQHMEALVDLVLEDLLERPLAELVDPEPMADALVAGMRASVDQDETREWLRDQVRAALERVRQEPGTLMHRVPMDALPPVKDLLSRPYSPDPHMLRALVDHKAMRNLMRVVLTASLTDFASMIKPPTANLGKGRLAQWAGAATVAAKMVGSEVERQLEGRIQTFVDGAISHAIGNAVNHMAKPENAKEYGQMRSDMVDVALAFPVKMWVAELDKLDPDALIDDVHALLKVAVHSSELESMLRDGLQQLVDEQGSQSARSFLAGSGLEQSWRPPLQELLLKQSRQVVESPAFAAWLSALVAG